MKQINELYSQDKPREKMLKKGPEALKDYELIAVLLGSGIKGKDVLKLAREINALISKEFTGLNMQRLLQIRGLGAAKASQLMAAVELSRRRLQTHTPTIYSAKDVWQELNEYAFKKQEYFLAITLDGASRLISKRVITVGILNQSLVHPREVFADAVSERAAGIIVAHNHPSGQKMPSNEDRRVTKRLKDAGRILGIELLDHVILTKKGYYSFSDEGEI